MISGPKYKICRRLGPGVYEKCATPKFALSQERKGKGRGDGRRRGSESEFGRELLEKQRIRFSYGMTEGQFGNYVKKAAAAKKKNPSLALYESLEKRLDNVVYRMGLASTRRLGRQIVSHGHITVNGVRQRVPSYLVKEGDKIDIRDGSRKSTLFSNLGEKLKNHRSPKWLSFDKESGKGAVTSDPAPESADLLEPYNTVLEFYSR